MKLMDKLINNIKFDKKYVFFSLILVILGVITGSIFIVILNSTDKNLVIEYISNFIENIKNSDVIITKVTGYAQGAGIPLNSKVISINDDIINNKSELIDVLYKYNSGDSVELMVEVSSGVYETYTLIV